MEADGIWKAAGKRVFPHTLENALRYTARVSHTYHSLHRSGAKPPSAKPNTDPSPHCNSGLVRAYNAPTSVLQFKLEPAPRDSSRGRALSPVETSTVIGLIGC